MSHDDPLGDRMKRYENASNPLLVPRSPLLLRVDGRAFHTWTRGLDRPFDSDFTDAMIEATRLTAPEMAGFKLAYTQSDEATFLVTDFDQLDTQGWFGYRLNKLVSITASIFTAYFNRLMVNRTGAPAFFDCRAFTVPVDDAPNVFVWRQKDWARNSVQMIAQTVFSPSRLHGKSLDEVRAMEFWQSSAPGAGDGLTIQDGWDDLSDALRYGTFVFRDGSTASRYLGFEEIATLITPPQPTTDVRAVLASGRRVRELDKELLTRLDGK